MRVTSQTVETQAREHDFNWISTKIKSNCQHVMRSGSKSADRRQTAANAPNYTYTCRYASLRGAKKPEWIYSPHVIFSFFNHCNASNFSIKFISVKRRENIIKFSRNGQECDVSAMSNAVHIHACVWSRFTVVICCLMGTNRKYSQEAVHAAGVMDPLWWFGWFHHDDDSSKTDAGNKKINEKNKPLSLMSDIPKRYQVPWTRGWNDEHF